jgi:O-antigen ligase
MIAITVAAAGLIDSKVIRYLRKIGGAVAVIACIVIFSYIGLRSRLSEELQNSATNTGTLQWRIEGWVESVSADQSPLSVLIGLPVGSGYIRLDPGAGGYTNFPPHNEIVNQYLRVGVLGAVIVTLFMFRPIYIYFRDPDSGSLLYPTPASWIVVTIGVIVFGIPYSFSLELFALVAMANRLMEAPSEGTYGQFPAFQSFKAASR